MSQSLAVRNNGGRRLKKYTQTVTVSGSGATQQFSGIVPAGEQKPGVVCALTVECPIGSPIALNTGIVQDNSDGRIDAWIATLSGGNLADGDYTATLVVVAE